MTYQPLWVNHCQNSTCRRTVVELFQLQLREIDAFIPFPSVSVPKENTVARLGFELDYLVVLRECYPQRHSEIVGYGFKSVLAETYSENVAFSLKRRYGQGCTNEKTTLCTIGPTFGAVNKEVRRKRNTQTRR